MCIFRQIALSQMVANSVHKILCMHAYPAQVQLHLLKLLLPITHVHCSQFMELSISMQL